MKKAAKIGIRRFMRDRLMVALKSDSPRLFATLRVLAILSLGNPELLLGYLDSSICWLGFTAPLAGTICWLRGLPE